MNGTHDGGLGAADLDAAKSTSSGDAGSSGGVCKAGGPLSSSAVLPIVTPWIIITNQPIVLVKKPYTNPARRQVTLSVDDLSFDGSGTFTYTGNQIDFYTQPVGGTAIPSGKTFTSGELVIGATLWAEGVSPSKKMLDVELILALTPGTKLVKPPHHELMTSVEVTLDIHKSRTKAGEDGAVLTVAEKTTKPGRIVHVQDTKFHHGRALVAIQKAAPADFTGTLILTQENANVRVYDTAFETGAATNLGPTYKIPNGDIKDPKASPVKRLWAEGAVLSGKAGDTGFRLGVEGVDTDGDRVKMTSVQFSKIAADIPSTPANQIRTVADGGGSNSPVPRHRLELANPPTATNYDEDFSDGANEPLVLIEDSVLASDLIKMSVEIKPTDLGVPVRWSAQRDRSATGDHNDIIAFKGNDALTLDPVTGTLLLDNVGSFHLRPYIDCNGSNQFEYNDDKGVRIDREPFVIMNLVIVRVQSLVNNSRANPGAFDPAKVTKPGINYAGGVPARLSTGDGKGTGNDAANMEVIARVVGGGVDGTRGLKKVFASWCNNELDAPTSPGPGGHGEDVTHHFRKPIPPRAVPPLPPLLRTRCFWKLDGAEVQGPMLDSGYGATEGTGGDTCTGTMGSNGNWPPKTKVADPSGVGERWTIVNGDPPSSGILSASPADATATLRRFTFNLDWRCALLFWTNRKGVQGADDFPACRLYVTVQTNTWRVRLESTFDDAFVETKVQAINAIFDKDTQPTRRATPVAGTLIETRAPDGVGQLRTNVAF